MKRKLAFYYGPNKENFHVGCHAMIKFLPVYMSLRPCSFWCTLVGVKLPISTSPPAGYAHRSPLAVSPIRWSDAPRFVPLNTEKAQQKATELFGKDQKNQEQNPSVYPLRLPGDCDCLGTRTSDAESRVFK